MRQCDPSHVLTLAVIDLAGQIIAQAKAHATHFRFMDSLTIINTVELEAAVLKAGVANAFTIHMGHGHTMRGVLIERQRVQQGDTLRLAPGSLRIETETSQC